MMRFSLKKPPPKAMRPNFFNITRWFVLLSALMMVIMLVVYVLVASDSGKYWMVVVAICWIVAWIFMFFLYLTYYLLMQIRANSWDGQREIWLFEQTRKSRRVLQILHVEFITAADFSSSAVVHNEAEGNGCSQLQIFMDNVSQMKMQSSWQKGVNLSLSRISYDADSVQGEEDLLPEEFLYQNITKIISSLAEKILLFHGSQHITVLFEVNISVSSRLLRNIWQQAWQESGIKQPVEFVDGSGLAYADSWLNERIQDDALLLVVAVQIAPENPEGTGEAVVGLLLGNRLTQKTLEPLALLHRPDCSAEDELETGLAQAAYHVPLNDTKLQHFWQCGLNQKQREAVTIQRQSPLLSSVESENIHDIDGSLGQTGCAAPWLAVAMAALAAKKLHTPQMIISSDAGHEAIWSAVLSPMAPRQELDT